MQTKTKVVFIVVLSLPQLLTLFSKQSWSSYIGSICLLNKRNFATHTSPMIGKIHIVSSSTTIVY